jgi:hypothetical protein
MIEAAMHAALLSQGVSTFTITSAQTKQYLSQFNCYQQTTSKLSSRTAKKMHQRCFWKKFNKM